MSLAQESSLEVVCSPHHNFLLLKEVAGCPCCWQHETVCYAAAQHTVKQKGPMLNSELTKKGKYFVIVGPSGNSL